MFAGVNVLLSVGAGSTVTTTFSPALLQPEAVVTYIYVTAIGSVVVFVSVSLTLPAPPVPGSVMPATVARVVIPWAKS